MLKVFNPATQELISTVPQKTTSEAKQVLADMAEFQKKRQFPSLKKRIEILKEFHSLVSKNRIEIEATAIAEGGKPLKDTRVELERALNGIELSISCASLQGQKVATDLNTASENHLSYTQREPLGVILAFSAFNHPINLFIHQVCPAIIAGSSVLYKASESTPNTAELLIKLLHEAGCPPLLADTLCCDLETSSEIVSSDPIHLFSFIGASHIGWNLRSQLAPGVRCILEHGGVAPAIILPNCNWKQHIPSLVKAAYYHSGQVCVSLQKIFIPEEELEEFIREWLIATMELRCDDPSSSQCDLGPIIKPKETRRIGEWINEAIELGGQILGGGFDPEDEIFIPATTLLNPPKSSKIMNKEIFGPVACLISYEKVEEALEEVARIPFAFQASLFGNDNSELIKLSQQVRAGTVLINEHPAFRTDWMPFGGLDQSGLGIGGIENTYKDYTIEKLIVIKH